MKLDQDIATSKSLQKLTFLFTLDQAPRISQEHSRLSISTDVYSWSWGQCTLIAHGAILLNAHTCSWVLCHYGAAMITNEHDSMASWAFMSTTECSWALFSFQETSWALIGTHEHGTVLPWALKRDHGTLALYSWVLLSGHEWSWVLECVIQQLTNSWRL